MVDLKVAIQVCELLAKEAKENERRQIVEELFFVAKGIKLKHDKDGDILRNQAVFAAKVLEVAIEKIKEMP